MPRTDPRLMRLRKVRGEINLDTDSDRMHFISFLTEEFMHSAQMMSQITPLEVDILYQLCDLLHQTG